MKIKYIVLQLLSCVQLFAIPWTAAPQASLSFTISQSLLKLMSIESMMPSNHFILCHPLLLSSVFPSIRVFSNELVLHIRGPKCWRFSISPSNESDLCIKCQSIRALASVLPMNILCWFPLRLTGLISLLSKGLSRVFSSTTVWRHQFLSAQWSNSHIRTWLLEKP